MSDPENDETGSQKADGSREDAPIDSDQRKSDGSKGANVLPDEVTDLPTDDFDGQDDED